MKLSAVFLVVVMALASWSCQTTSLAARSKPNAKDDACSGMSLTRKDCQDSVGCYWDYQSNGCVPSH